MTKNEKDRHSNNDTTYKTSIMRSCKKKQHEPHQKLGVISGAPEGEAYPAPHVASVYGITNPVKV